MRFRRNFHNGLYASLSGLAVMINSTAFSGPFEDGCRECVCENGKVTCNSPECPNVSLTCTDPEMGEDCCPFCPNGKRLSRPN